MNISLKKKLAATTSLVLLLVGYNRRAYAACSLISGSSYLCSGSNASALSVSDNEATVSTAAGFGVNTAAGNTITITGDGALSLTDTITSSGRHCFRCLGFSPNLSAKLDSSPAFGPFLAQIRQGQLSNSIIRGFYMYAHLYASTHRSIR